jgi:hypothetical protein
MALRDRLDDGHSCAAGFARRMQAAESAGPFVVPCTVAARGRPPITRVHRDREQDS